MRKSVTVLTCSLYFTLVNLKLDLDYRKTRLISVRYQPGPVVKLIPAYTILQDHT